MATIAGFVLLAAFIPVVTLAVVGDDARSMFDGRYVVDDYALILKALFLLVGYVVVLMSQTELEEGGYYQGEFYVLLLVQRARHGDDGVGPRPRRASSWRSNCCRSRPT